MVRLTRRLWLLVGALMIAPAWAGQMITGLGGATLIVTESASNGQAQTAATLASPLNANGLRDGQLATVSPQNPDSLGVIPADTLGTQSSTSVAASTVSGYLQPAILNVETIITSCRLTLGAYEGFWSFSRASATRG
ncbi:MAG: hypothetical protein ACYCXX_14025 [Acidiferrobacter thiooxydans]